MKLDERKTLVSRRNVILGTLLGVPAAAMAVAMTAQQAQASGGGRDPGDEKDGCKNGKCGDDDN